MDANLAVKVAFTAHSAVKSHLHGTPYEWSDFRVMVQGVRVTGAHRAAEVRAGRST